MIRAFSFGGGVQSTAALVLAATGLLDYKTFCFANVGDDSENPATLDYLARFALPYAAAHGLEVHQLQRRHRDRTPATLYEALLSNRRSVDIPVRVGERGAPGRRNCTKDYKIKVIGAWLRGHGATAEDPALVGVGISLDEIERINSRKANPWERLAYPLVGVGDPTGLHMRRSDCRQVILDAGLPVPPKSACWFCPFHRPEQWQTQRREQPELFARAADLEDLLNERRAGLGRDPAYLTWLGMPLRKAIPEGVDVLFDLTDDGPNCDNGWCMT